MTSMKVGAAGKALFREWEGLELEEYLDSGGAPTIGIGHLLTRSERLSGKIILQGQSVRYRNGLTVEQCLDLLDQDLAALESITPADIQAAARTYFTRTRLTVAHILPEAAAHE